MTHDEIARRLGISRTRVQQIEKQAFAKMRAVLAQEHPEEFSTEDDAGTRRRRNYNP